MEITKYQIAEFLSNKCSAEDAERIANWLKDNPHALDDFFSEAEWEQFETTLQVDEATHLDMFARIKESQQAPVKRIAVNTWWRVAAAVLFCIMGAFLFKQLTNKPVPQQSAKVVVPKKPREVILANTTAKKVRYQLDDSSVVILSKNSQVTYNKPFDASKRDVYLQGEAFFEVTKDAHRPFTVFAKGFSTTALGTSFTISAYHTDAIAHVKLFTGKVMVKNLQQNKNAVYLLPGGECAFDYHSANLTKVSNNNITRKPAPQPAMPAVGAIEETADYVIFNSTRLTEVMKKLGELYNVRITYDSKAIAHKKFIGKVDKKNTVEEVLQTIAVLNDLHVTNNGNEYIIINNN